MRAEDLDEAIDLANDTPFGLTSGLQSLDDREVERWLERIEAGNLYVNRHITGAIVGRQPFGGWKGSSVGPGAKAGGPNYVLQLARWSQVGPPGHGRRALTRGAGAAGRFLHELSGDAAAQATLRRQRGQLCSRVADPLLAGSTTRARSSASRTFFAIAAAAA